MPKEIILEYCQIGNALKVSAIDSESGDEISFICPPITPRFEIERLAKAKLERYRLMKKQNSTLPDSGNLI